MLRILAIAISVIITSFYYFPFCFTAFPTVNTKQIIAVAGMIVWGIELSKRGNSIVSKGLINLSVFAIIFSLVCFFSVAYNGTSDYAYATYIISMWVWLAGAYGVCWLIKTVHGSVSFQTLSHYLIVVCVIQCFLALFIDYSPAFKTFIDAHIWQDQEFLTEAKRLYGIGAMLDTAGIRFSIALILLSYFITYRKAGDKIGRTLLYVFAFAFIIIVGNMIARTTSVGVILGLLYMSYRQFFGGENCPFTMKELTFGVLMIIFVCIPVITYFYSTDAAFHENLRFGFEGFFSLMETGKWQVGSNDQLKSMIVFPETTKTWLIGDGYFNNPIATDIYFTGKVTGGYYMGTDIGYLRFIFYCGIIGLLAFSLYICKAVSLCMERFPTKKLLLLFLGVLNFMVWFKVSTDIFLIFALLLMADSEETTNELPTTGIVIK